MDISSSILETLSKILIVKEWVFLKPCNVLTLMLMLWLTRRLCKHYVDTHDNQFGIKSSDSTYLNIALATPSKLYMNYLSINFSNRCFLRFCQLNLRQQLLSDNLNFFVGIISLIFRIILDINLILWLLAPCSCFLGFSSWLSILLRTFLSCFRLFFQHELGLEVL